MAVQVEARKKARFRVGPLCTSPYPAHIHDPVEIAIVRRGHLNITVNGTAYAMGPNTVTIIFPGMVHSYDNASEDAAGLFVGFTPDVIDEFRNALINMWPEVPMLKISNCPAEIEEAIRKLEEYSASEGNYPLMLSYIHLLTACLFTQLELNLNSSAELNKDNFMHKVLYYIQQHSQENLTLDSVAKEMGVGRSHLSHLFSQKLNINFRRFLNAVRIEKACVLLQDTSLSIKEVCYESGFTNTRTFHRAFLDEQKMTPAQYRAQIRTRWRTSD